MDTHFLDLRVMPDPELPAATLMSALYERLHLALARARRENLAVSFPGYNIGRGTVGDRLRLVGSLDELATLMAQPWLGGLRDQLSIDDAQVIPATAEHRTLHRVQAKSSPARLRRRQMRRHGLSEAEAAERVPDNAAERLDLPFVAMRSASTGQSFRLYLRLGPTVGHAMSGQFNSYGLSADATVPWF